MSFFRSITGDIPSEQMGITYSHEHIVIEESFPTLGNPDFLLNDAEKIAAELSGLKTLGCSTMVDTMPANCGRNVLKSVGISKKTGINIIIPTGIHLEIYYPPGHWRYTYTEEQLSDLFISDIITGIDKYDYNGPIIERTPYKAGLIKLATGDGPFTKHQEKIFHAVVNAHIETGAPILTHTNNGNQAIEQAELFEKLGANLKHIVLSHVDRNKDLRYHKALMQTGVSVEYDSAFRWKATDENWTYTLLEKLLPEYPGQITAGMDAARNTYWRAYGGKPGLDYLLTTFREELNKRGLRAYFNNIFIDNPKRIFGFEKGADNQVT
ncbi:MAG TPA: aryldialkylphosphatase [Mucilaginibacter sp.]|jgi:phosphotriesterase-related protein|nr:aryldialkylphosphatase [Mucilaginibacter sp.]